MTVEIFGTAFTVLAPTREGASVAVNGLLGPIGDFGEWECRFESVQEIYERTHVINRATEHRMTRPPWPRSRGELSDVLQFGGRDYAALNDGNGFYLIEGPHAGDTFTYRGQPWRATIGSSNLTGPVRHIIAHPVSPDRSGA